MHAVVKLRPPPHATSPTPAVNLFAPLLLTVTAFAPQDVSDPPAVESDAVPGAILPAEADRDPAVPAPAAVLGFEVGERHLRHDQVVTYLRALAGASDRVTVDEYARSHDGRPLVALTVTAPANHARLDGIRTAHLALAARDAPPVAGGGPPAVVWAGYGVHGDEASASNAAVLVAYHLASSRSAEVTRVLENCVVLLDPCLNPDGFDRFAAWANTHRGRVPNPDPDHREHHQPTPTGRTNGYWFDLNRDWLPAVHPESRGRLALYRRWLPNVVLDFHEMHTDGTYFFQPGVPARTHPLTPRGNVELTQQFAVYHAAALDRVGQPFFTEERFDDFYMGKGSTYPDLHGGVGILFEQAGARGLAQEGIEGTVRFPTAIRNHVLTSLSSLRAAADLRAELNTHLRDFYAADPDRDAPVRGYVVVPAADPVRTAEFAETLARHGIDVRVTAKELNSGDRTFPAGSMWVPLGQPESRFARALFDTRTDFAENVFYDVSAWTLPDAFGLRWAAVERVPDGIAGGPWADRAVGRPAVNFSADDVAYLLDARHAWAVRAVYRLLDAGARVKVATEPFAAVVAGEDAPRDFGRGTLLVPARGIGVDGDAVRRLLRTAVEEDGVPVDAVAGGLTPTGVDLGSAAFVPLAKPRVVLATGDGVGQYGTGAVWHELDGRLGLPVTLVDAERLGSVDLTDDTVLVLPGGSYGDVPKSAADRIGRWLRGGGTAVAIGSAVRWADRAGLVDVAFRSPEKEDGDAAPERRAYADAEIDAALELVGGAIFAAEADVTHPLCYGLEDGTLPVFRDAALWLEPSPNPYSTPVVLTEKPLRAGYASGQNRELAAGSAEVRVERVGAGRVILMPGDPVFRGFWWGTRRLLVNAVMHGGLVRVP